MDRPEKAISKINTGKDKKNDMMIMISSQAGWDQFLTPAPLAISLLGELILVSSKIDFSLEEKPPKDGFKFLNHPESFRTCLVQVSNDGWSAFNQAHTNMDQIRLYSSNVETHVRNAVKFLMTGTPDEIEQIVPMSLNKVSDIADDCKALAIGIEDKFVRVMDVTAELLETCTAVKGSYDKRYDDASIELKIAKGEKERVEKSRKEMEERSKRLEQDVQEAQSEFKDAMDSIPTGMKAIGLSLAEGVVNGIKGCINLIPNALQRKIDPSKGSGTSQPTSSDTSKPGTREAAVDENKAYSLADIVCSLINNLHDFATKEKRDEQPYPEISSESQEGVMFILKSLQQQEEYTRKSKQYLLQNLPVYRYAKKESRFAKA